MPGRGPDVPDGWELNKDGTITLTIANERHRLRRPKLGEFRDLRDALRQRDDDRLRVIAKHPPADELAEGASDEEKLEHVLAINARSRAINDAVQELNVAWVKLVLDTLGAGDAPESDDWPSGSDDSNFIEQLMAHWRAVPLRSGGG